MLIEGWTTVESVDEFVNNRLECNDEQEITINGAKKKSYTTKLRDDIKGWKNNSWGAATRGLLGIVIDKSTLTIDNYTWSFGQKTDRRLNTFKRDNINALDEEEDEEGMRNYDSKYILVCVKLGSSFEPDDGKDVLKELKE